MGCPPRVVRGAAAHAATASGVNHTVRLPRARRPASYSAQLVTRCRCFGMWRRQAALALNGTAGGQASGEGPSSSTAQLPTPTGRSVQQGGIQAVVLHVLISDLLDIVVVAHETVHFPTPSGMRFENILNTVLLQTPAIRARKHRASGSRAD